MQVVQLQSFDLDLTTIKVLVVSLDRNLKKELFKKLKKSELKQKLFHKHYCSDGDKGIANWCVTLIDQIEDKKVLRKKELCWINKLNTWDPVGLNVREVYKPY